MSELPVLAEIVAIGARTPIGLDAVQTGFLHRTGIPAVEQGPFVDGEGEPIAMALVRALEPSLPWEARLTALLRPALDEAFDSLGDTSDLSSQLLLGVPARLAGGAQATAGPAAAMGRYAQQRLPNLRSWRVDPNESGATVAMQQALSGLGPSELLVLAGVHSDHDQGLIDTLAAEQRLYTAARFDGRLAGEAGAVAVLASSECVRRHRLTSLAEVIGIGSGLETARPDNDEPAARARGLTEAVQLATEPLARAGLRAGWMITDVAFEAFRQIEWQSVYVRASHVLGDPYMIDAVPQRLGYAGAATVPLALTLAAQAWRGGYAPAPCALLTAGSDDGARIALAVRGK